MVIEYNGSQIPTSFASCSITYRHGENLRNKISAIRNAGFDGMEIAMPDILAYGRSTSGIDFDEQDYDFLVGIAAIVKRLADEIGVKILMLQPFARFEGWAGDEKEAVLDRAAGWLRIMDALGTTMLQVGSSDSVAISSSLDDRVEDLTLLADMCANKGYRVAYENWCWATYTPTWKSAWEIVKRVNRPNMGLCLDTFQTAGSELADPTTSSGFIEGFSSEDLEMAWKTSLQDLSATIPAEKIFLLQISDAYKMSPPTPDLDQDGERPRAQWSHKHRPLPGKGGYLPVREVLRAVLATGFRGWLSVEVFDPEVESKSPNEKYAIDAMGALNKLLSE